MSIYVIAIIWVISNVLCFYIVQKKELKLGFIARLAGVLLGPVAIPFVVAIKPKTAQDS